MSVKARSDDNGEKWALLPCGWEYRAQPSAEQGTACRKAKAPQHSSSWHTPRETSFHNVPSTLATWKWVHFYQISSSKRLTVFHLLSRVRHWPMTLYQGIRAPLEVGILGGPGTSPSWIPGDNLSFWEVRLHADFWLQEGCVVQGSAVYKSVYCSPGWNT